jgi:hypothetical protein
MLYVVCYHVTSHTSLITRSDIPPSRITISLAAILGPLFFTRALTANLYSLYKRCIETNRMIVILKRFRQIVNKSLHSFPVFVNVAVKHCTNSDHLQNKRSKHYECPSVALIIQHTTNTPIPQTTATDGMVIS